MGCSSSRPAAESAMQPKDPQSTKRAEAAPEEPSGAVPEVASRAAFVDEQVEEQMEGEGEVEEVARDEAADVSAAPKVGMSTFFFFCSFDSATSRLL